RGCSVHHVLPQELRYPRRLLAPQLWRANEPRVHQPRTPRCEVGFLLRRPATAARIPRELGQRRQSWLHGRSPRLRVPHPHRNRPTGSSIGAPKRKSSGGGASPSAGYLGKRTQPSYSARISGLSGALRISPAFTSAKLL